MFEINHSGEGVPKACYLSLALTRVSPGQMRRGMRIMSFVCGLMRWSSSIVLGSDGVPW
jgi:hypothetical protein